MTSVSNIAIGANLAGAAADKARHGMNESITRLSTGVRAMYGGDAAGHSIGTSLTAKSKSFAMVARGIEDGISLLQMQESMLLEASNLFIRGRELGIQDDALGLHDSNQIAARDAEITALTDTIDQLITETHWNGKDLEQTDISIGFNDASIVHTIGMGGSGDITAADDTDATDYDAQADTGLQEISINLGKVAADLAVLKSIQAINANSAANMQASAARIMDTDFAKETSSLTKNTILNQAAQSMVAQANQAQSAILAVLQ